MLPTDIGTARAGSSVPAMILAGGRARRMGGGDKALLSLGGRAVLDHVLEGLRPQAAPLAINANGDPARFAAWGLPVVADMWPDQPGPLAGVLTAMRWAEGVSHRVLTWPGDTPHPPPDLVARLEAAPGLACAASGGRVHPVIALWPVALADSLVDQLRAGRHRVLEFAEFAGLTVVAWPGSPDPFANLNTPADLAAAEAGAASSRPALSRAAGSITAVPPRPGR